VQKTFVTAVLPNKEEDSLLTNQRKLEIQERKEMYDWMQDMGFPGFISYNDQLPKLPRDIQFDGEKLISVINDNLIGLSAEGAVLPISNEIKESMDQ